MRALALARGRLALILMALSAMVLVAACQAGRPATPTAGPTAVPAPPGGKVVFSGTYSGNVQPIFTQKCVDCHGPTRAENGLRLDSYEGVLKGTQFGPIVVPGQPNQSAMVSVIRGTGSPGSPGKPKDPGIRMPHGGVALSEQEVQNIVLWIEAGAPKN